MRPQGVPLCNISWGFTAADIENNLAQNGIGNNADDRARRAAGIYDIMYKGMERALAASPDILFVVSAGNAGQDVDFVRDLPGKINLPNVLTVGAVDAGGRLATFASKGASVDFYARGADILGVVPGGGKLLWSGASLAAPQVVNAAARLLPVRPDLSVAELASILKRTAEPVRGSDLPLLNPRAAERMIAAEARQ
jgi:subtilisin family serine protease